VAIFGAMNVNDMLEKPVNRTSLLVVLLLTCSAGCAGSATGPFPGRF
jgi:hypothetical protein